MIEQLVDILPPVFVFTTVLYLWMAVRVSRASIESANNTVSYFLFLIGMMTAGSAFAYGATDAHMYGIGRTLTFFGSGFVPVALYTIYREFTVGRPHMFVIAALSIVPVISTGLAMTNELHHLIWSVVEINGEIRFTEPDKHFWFKRVHAPYSFGLFGFSIIAMAGRLPTIARAIETRCFSPPEREPIPLAAESCMPTSSRRLRPN